MSIRKLRGPAALALSLALLATPVAVANATEPDPDTTAPTITLKPETVLSNGRATSASYKLYDAGKVDKVVVNGVVKDLSNNVWSDLNSVKPGKYGAVEGSNTLVAFDTLGNCTTFTFTLDTTIVEPETTVVTEPEPEEPTTDPETPTDTPSEETPSEEAVPPFL